MTARAICTISGIVLISLAIIGGCPSVWPEWSRDTTPLTTGGGGTAGTGVSSDDSSTPDASDGAGGSDDATGGGSSEATAVADFLPTAISTDMEVNELPEDADDEVVESGSPGRNTYERVVRTAATVLLRFHRLADFGLALGARVREDITDPNQVYVSGTFPVYGREIPYKADFSAFDFDGDGTADGSGVPSLEPVALRLWIDRGDGSGYQRFLCALITKRPTQAAPANFGQGKLYFKPRIGDPNAPLGVQLYVEYDRTGATWKWNQAYIAGQIHPLYNMPIGLARVDVRLNTSSQVEKTVRAAQKFSANPYNFQDFRSAVHFMPGQSGVLTSFLYQLTDGGQFSMTEVCTNILTHQLATGGECVAFDKTDMTLLDVPAEGKADFPASFPETPTF